jgi:GMP synthase-like glutamine amidotransferase
MNIHCFQHVAFEGLACMEGWIAKKGHQLGYTRFFNGDPLPDLDALDMLIVMGGPMSFDDDEKHPWMTGERDFIRQAITKGKTVLGICLGAQLIADAIDGSARHGHSQEIGWFPVSFKAERKKMGLDFIPDELVVFHWHGDTFDTPKGAVALASTPEYPNQAFLYRNNVLGLQFHFEMNEKTVKDMVENVDEELVKGKWVQSKNEILEGIAHTQSNMPMMWKIMDYLEQHTMV